MHANVSKIEDDDDRMRTAHETLGSNPTPSSMATNRIINESDRYKILSFNSERDNDQGNTTR